MIEHFLPGLKAFPDTPLETAYPKTSVQLCIVHMVRYSLNYVSWKLRAEVAAGLRTIYVAATVEDGWQRLDEFETKWGRSVSAHRPCPCVTGV